MHPTAPTSKRLLALLVGLLATACATARPEATAAAQPTAAPAAPRAFLWEVTRPDAPERPLFLTGSIHMGQPGQFVLPPSFEAAFEKAETLVVEVHPEEMKPAQVQQLVLKYGVLRPPDTLDAHLSAETRALLPEAIARLGLNPVAVGQLRPWMVSMMLAVLEVQKAGYDSEGGLDRLLMKRAEGTKALVALETAEEQMRMFAGFSESLQDTLLREQLQQSAQTVTILSQMMTAWEEGDAEAVARVAFEHVSEPTYQPYYEGLFYARNRKMADALVTLMEQPRTHFVVVGAGHVVGEQGLVALLEGRGFKVRQLPRE